VSGWISIASVVRPQGRHGEVLAEILTDFPERFTGMREASLRRSPTALPTPVTIERAWLHKGRVVLKFASINSISQAELLRGAEVVIPFDARTQLGEDAAYIDDLIGCEVIDTHRPGSPVIGTVRDVLQQEISADLLSVVGNDGTEHWIPFAKAYLVRIDVAARRIEMQLPPGLLEVNAPLSEEERKAQFAEAQAAKMETAEDDSTQ